MSLRIPAARSGRSALEVARQAAREAGEVARAAFGQPKEVTVKGRGNLVTETDLEIERLLLHTFAREFPDHRVLSEESAAETTTQGWLWVVDPLDGTRNFVSGIPFFAVSLALCYDGAPVVAVTHDPSRDETFWAERGRGAWLDDQPVHTSGRPSVQASVLGFGLGYDDERGRQLLHLIEQLYPGVQTLRSLGSAALGLAYAACGRFDLFVHFDLFPWDLAAGMLLIEGAGGVVTEPGGSAASIASRAVIAGGRAAHADLVRWQRQHAELLDLRPEG